MFKTDAIVEEIAVVRAAIDTLESSVEGDFTAEQEAESETLIARLSTLKEDLAKAEAREAAKADADAVVARVRTAAPAPKVVVKSEPAQAGPNAAGEYLVARIAADNAIREGRDPNGAVQAFRALSDVYMADVDGIIPVPVLPNVLDRTTGARPVFSALTAAGPVPAKTWEQPEVTGHTSVDIQTNEGDELASSKYTVDTYSITAATYGGAVVLSAQAIDFSSPSALQKVVEDLEKQYNRKTEAVASAALNAAAVENVTWSTSSIAALAASFHNAYAALEDNLDEVDPSNLRLFLSPDEYAKHMSLFTTEGNSYISQIPGFPQIVRGRRLPDYSILLADVSACRIWESRKGQNQIMRVSTLEYEIGIYGHLGMDFQTGAVVDGSFAGS